MRPRPLPGRSGSVSDDWRAWLPEDQGLVFRWTAGELEAAYTMLSVALNEAIALREGGELGKAQQEAGCCAQLVARFAGPLAGTLRALETHARHYGTLPNVVALDAANFRCARSQRVAWMHAVLCRVLFSDRSRFFHKLHTLGELVEELAAHFRQATLDLADGAATDPADLWDSLDALHYDLNTCLRETIILLKSFLRVLPEEEVEAFRQSIEGQAKAGSAEAQERLLAPRDRRPASISRK